MIMSVKGFWFDSGWDFPSEVDGKPGASGHLNSSWNRGMSGKRGIYPPVYGNGERMVKSRQEPGVLPPNKLALCCCCCCCTACACRGFTVCFTVYGILVYPPTDHLVLENYDILNIFKEHGSGVFSDKPWKRSPSN